MDVCLKIAKIRLLMNEYFYLHFSANAHESGHKTPLFIYLQAPLIFLHNNGLFFHYNFITLFNNNFYTVFL